MEVLKFETEEKYCQKERKKLTKTKLNYYVNPIVRPFLNVNSIVKSNFILSQYKIGRNIKFLQRNVGEFRA